MSQCRRRVRRGREALQHRRQVAMKEVVSREVREGFYPAELEYREANDWLQDHDKVREERLRTAQDEHLILQDHLDRGR